MTVGSWMRGPRRRAVRGLAVLVLPLALAACFPAIHGSYYRPDYDDPNIRRLGDMCHGATGRPSRIVIPMANDGRLTATVDATDDGRRTMQLDVELPVGQGPDWGDGRLRWQAGARQGVLPVVDAESRRYLAWRAAEPVTTRSLGVPAGATELDAKLGWMLAWREVGEPPAITLRLPRVAAAGAPDGTPEGAFTEVELAAQPPGLGIGDSVRYRTQAENEVVRARVAACEPKGDAKRCAWLAETDRGFELAAGDVQWKGRAWLYRPAREKPLRLEIDAEVKRPLPWRVNVPQPMVVGVPAPREERMTVSVRWRAPLASRIPAPMGEDGAPPRPPGAGLPALRQTLRVPLPPETPEDFELRLPGDVLAKPIRFERRAFELGILPFNC